MKLAGIIRESIVDGPGIRFVIFSQGCPHGCKGCHNPDTHDFEGGFESDTATILTEIKKNPLLSGVTFSGGEPFCQAKEFSKLALEIKTMGLSIMTYSGYTFEQLLNDSNDDNCWKMLLEATDILVDGPFEEENKNLLLKFRGSSNQRVLDANKSTTDKKAVLYTFS
ncbi:MAG: anaerobic ribonucleoside-triphosphate reductase activating protein [Proteocatella sp.]